MKPSTVSTLLIALALTAFNTHAAAQEFAPDDLSLESGETVELQQPATIVEQLPEQLPEPLPEPQVEPPAQPATTATPSPPPPVPLPPVEPPPDDGRLTLAEAEALATSFHPFLREASGNLGAAQGNWLQAGLRPNPTIAYAGTDIGDSGTAGKQGGYVSQEFVTAGKLGLNRAVAMRGVGAAQQRAEIARLQILTTVRVQYFELAAAERGVMLSRQLGDIARESVRTSESRLQALDIPRSSLLQSQIESESTALLEQQAAERYNAAWRRMAASIGVTDPNPVPLEDAFARPLPQLAWECTRDRVLGGSPEVAELRYNVERARYQVQSASAQRVPNVTALVGAQHDNSTGDNIANVELSMPLPIFDRNQGGVMQACGQLTAAQAALRDRELAIEHRLAIAMRDYEVARTRVMRYAEKVLPAARESLEIMNAGYAEGELDYLQLLTIQQTYAEKNLAYLQDLETAWKRWAEIEGMLVGVLPSQMPGDAAAGVGDTSYILR